MRKYGIAAALCAVALAIPATAFALNEYTLSTSFSPSKAGTVKRPVPAGVRLGFDVRDTEGKRPLGLEALRIKLTGTVFNGAFFRSCTATAITQAQSDANCPAGSRVATGFANNIAGNRSNRDDQSLRCYLALRLYNAGRGKMALFVQGSKASGPGTPQYCPLDIAVAIPVSIATSSTGSTLNLTIPESLRHPVATLTNSLYEMRLNLPRKTVRKRGKTRGFLENRGRCRGGRRAATFTFSNEGGNVVSQSVRARCTR